MTVNRALFNDLINLDWLSFGDIIVIIDIIKQINTKQRGSTGQHSKPRQFHRSLNTFSLRLVVTVERVHAQEFLCCSLDVSLLDRDTEKKKMSESGC